MSVTKSVEVLESGFLFLFSYFLYDPIVDFLFLFLEILVLFEV